MRLKMKMNKKLNELKDITYKENFSEESLLSYIDEENNQERFLFEFKQNNLLSKNKSMLNIGAGRGGLSAALIKKYYKVDSLEYNPVYCEIIIWRFKKMKLNGKIMQGPIEEFKSKNKYDLILLTDVIEHVYNPKKSLENIHYLLNNNGKVYITVPNRYHLYDPHYKLPFILFMPRKISDLILKIIGKYKTDKSAGMQSLSEMHYYTYNQFKKIVNSIGFEVIDLRKREISNPDKYLYKKSQKTYFKVVKFFKFLKLENIILFPLVRIFFGHKLVLVKK